MADYTRSQILSVIYLLKKMTRDTLHISTQVLPGNKIEIATPELNVGEVVEVLILAKTPQNNQDKNESDPLIGLFKSSPDLATQSEEILHQEIQEESGWTWK
jgi:hypothetical protein